MKTIVPITAALFFLDIPHRPCIPPLARGFHQASRMFLPFISSLFSASRAQPFSPLIYIIQCEAKMQNNFEHNQEVGFLPCTFLFLSFQNPLNASSLRFPSSLASLLFPLVIISFSTKSVFFFPFPGELLFFTPSCSVFLPQWPRPL